MKPTPASRRRRVDQTITPCALAPENAATPYDNGLMNSSSDEGSRRNCTLTYPLPSKSAGSATRWTELVVVVLNH